MRTRISILTDLIQLNGNISDFKKELSYYSWDVDRPVIKFHNVDFIRGIEKCVGDVITISELVDWCNVIECREDIEFETEQIKELIHELANPEINGVVTKEKLSEIVISLSQ